MKNPIALFVVLLLFAVSVSATEKKIYLITAADPTDAKQSEVFVKDAATIQDTFNRSSQSAYGEFFPRNFFPPELYRNNRVVVYNDTWFAGDWKGPETVVLNSNREDGSIEVLKNLVDAVNSCPAGADDSIVVYWSGHGGYDNDEHLLLTSDKKGKLRRADLLDALKAKNVRLVVLLTDACADELGKLEPIFKEQETDYLDEGAVAAEAHDQLQRIAPPEPRILPLFDELFFWHKGIVDINASKKGEKAFSVLYTAITPVKSVSRGRVVKVEKREENVRMGYFTAALFADVSWTDIKITADSRSLAKKDELDYMKYATDLSLKENINRNRNRGGGVSADDKAPLGVVRVNSIKRLTWNDLEKRMIENTEMLFNNAPREQEIKQELQTPDIKLEIEHIIAGLDDRLMQDDEWDAQRAQWIQKNYKTLQKIRGINLTRLARAYNMAAIVLQILRMSGVNVPGLPMIPGNIGNGGVQNEIQRQIRGRLPF